MEMDKYSKCCHEVDRPSKWCQWTGTVEKSGKVQCLSASPDSPDQTIILN